MIIYIYGATSYTVVGSQMGTLTNAALTNPASSITVQGKNTFVVSSSVSCQGPGKCFGVTAMLDPESQHEDSTEPQQVSQQQQQQREQEEKKWEAFRELRMKHRAPGLLQKMQRNGPSLRVIITLKGDGKLTREVSARGIEAREQSYQVRQTRFFNNPELLHNCFHCFFRL
jgi:hypothetical protein